jgi:hypothetical protein
MIEKIIAKLNVVYDISNVNIRAIRRENEDHIQHQQRHIMILERKIISLKKQKTPLTNYNQRLRDQVDQAEHDLQSLKEGVIGSLTSYIGTALPNILSNALPDLRSVKEDTENIKHVRSLSLKILIGRISCKHLD